jgi:hypothetical protein
LELLVQADQAATEELAATRFLRPLLHWVAGVAVLLLVLLPALEIPAVLEEVRGPERMVVMERQIKVTTEEMGLSHLQALTHLAAAAARGALELPVPEVNAEMVEML